MFNLNYYNTELSFFLIIYLLLFIIFFLTHLNTKIDNFSLNNNYKLKKKISMQLLNKISSLLISTALIIAYSQLSLANNNNNININFIFFNKYLFWFLIILLCINFVMSHVLNTILCSFYFLDFLLISYWFIFSTSLLLSTTSICMLFITIELYTLCIFIFLLNLPRQHSNLNSNSKIYNVNFNFNVFKLFLILIWSSTLSSLCFIWSILFISNNLYASNISFLKYSSNINFTKNKITQYNNNFFVNLILMISISNKLLIFPAQFWIVSFYKTIQVYSLIIYLIYIYLFSVIVFVDILYFFSFFFFKFNIIIFYIIFNSILFILLSQQTIKNFYDIRIFFANSSYFNIITLLLLICSLL